MSGAMVIPSIVSFVCFQSNTLFIFPFSFFSNICVCPLPSYLCYFFMLVFVCNSCFCRFNCSLPNPFWSDFLKFYSSIVFFSLCIFPSCLFSSIFFPSTSFRMSWATALNTCKNSSDSILSQESQVRQRLSVHKILSHPAHQTLIHSGALAERHAVRQL